MTQKKYIFCILVSIIIFVTNTDSASWLSRPKAYFPKKTVSSKELSAQKSFKPGYEDILNPSLNRAQSVGEKGVSVSQKKASLYDRLKKLLQSRDKSKVQAIEKESPINPNYVDPQVYKIPSAVKQVEQSGYKKLYPDVSGLKEIESSQLKPKTLEDELSEIYEGPITGKEYKEVYGEIQKPVVGIPISPEAYSKGVVTGVPVYGRLKPLTSGAKNLSQKELAKIETEARRRYAEWIKAGKPK